VIRRALAIVAITGGALAPFAGTPHRATDIQQLAAAVEAEEDHVTAIELARWIHERKRSLRVVDLRTPTEFAQYHVPSSRNVALTSLVRGTLPKNDTIVLISGGGAHAAQAWVFLRTLGYRDVYFLRGGIDEWLRDVMKPVRPTPEQAALTRYFGGGPRISHDAPTAESIRRAGC
jgi:rhodanese-related sulfurtransferase